MGRLKVATCPACKEEFELEDDAEVGSIVYCPACQEELKIVSIYPIVLEAAGNVSDDDDRFLDDNGDSDPKKEDF